MTLTTEDLIDIMDQAAWYQLPPEEREAPPPEGLCNYMGAYDLAVLDVDLAEELAVATEHCSKIIDHYKYGN